MWLLLQSEAYTVPGTEEALTGHLLVTGSIILGCSDQQVTERGGRGRFSQGSVSSLDNLPLLPGLANSGTGTAPHLSAQLDTAASDKGTRAGVGWARPGGTDQELNPT